MVEGLQSLVKLKLRLLGNLVIRLVAQALTESWQMFFTYSDIW